MEHEAISRDNLRESLIATFASQDEIYQSFVFGREVEGIVDQFSDIDFVICSWNPQLTQTNYRNSFASIAPIRATCLLESTSDEFAEMILLEDCSPYQKVDFTIVDDISKKAWAAPFQVVYYDPAKKKPIQSSLQNVPFQQDITYQLNNILFSVPRFTKCLFRQDQDLYRRWNKLIETTLVLLHEKYFGWQFQTTKHMLAIPERKALMSQLSEEEREILIKLLPPNVQLNLPLSYQTGVRLFVRLAQEKAAHFETLLDTDFIGYTDIFLNDEIVHFLERQST